MSNIRKIGVLVGITGLVLAMASGTGFALTVNFDECPGGVCTDGAPTITLSNGGNVVILQTDAALPEPTASVVKATLSGTSADVIPVGQYFVTLMERPGVASDVITLTAGIQTS